MRESIRSLSAVIIACAAVSLAAGTIMSQDNPVRNGKDNPDTSFVICEGFSSLTFPPAGWVTTGQGAPFWARNVVSGYGLGTGSADFNMYAAPNGMVGSLVTPVFAPATANDYLAFDIAYCQSSSYIYDSLFILTSTDGGYSYSLLVMLSESQMATADSTCTHPFTPTASQWGRRTYLLPTGTNRISFDGHSGFNDHLYLDSICIVNPIGIRNINSEVPEQFYLYQNYPNPFNPVTIIRFQIPDSRLTTLKIYDIRGREVATLVNEKLNPGTHIVEWNASNLPSGVYFYTINASQIGDTRQFSSSRKMLLIK